eukprot:TRINITY_DN102302_c0_g1_i1.p1 TRINITY_DN102302_c0_g1~~TRINITY_DN102302_c0_g1_i1.p1  ORF type:complete len:662 (+),score=106.08 TRINITY_DN102302_c0_g1_i1:50-2035(+)
MTDRDEMWLRFRTQLAFACSAHHTNIETLVSDLWKDSGGLVIPVGLNQQVLHEDASKGEVTPLSADWRWQPPATAPLPLSMQFVEQQRTHVNFDLPVEAPKEKLRAAGVLDVLQEASAEAAPVHEAANGQRVHESLPASLSQILQNGSPLPTVQRQDSDDFLGQKVGASFVCVKSNDFFTDTSGVRKRLGRAAERSSVASCIQTIVDWWLEAREPDRNGFLARVVDHRLFEILSALAIGTNTVFICVVANADMNSVSSADADSKPPAWQKQTEWGFIVFYLLELAMRMLAHRGYFFINDNAVWNTLDFVLVLISVSEAVLHAAGGAGVNLMFLRILRLLKLSKLLRVVRAIRFLRELRVLAECLKGCMVQLFWAVVMMTMVLLVFSMFFVQALSTHLRVVGFEPYNEIGIDKDMIVQAFGSVQDSMLTLLQVVSGGSEWHPAYQFFAATGPMLSVVYLFFVIFFQVAVWNIVTSVFIENTMNMGGPDRDEEVFNKRRQDRSDAKELLAVCKEADTDFSGTVSVDEFDSFMDNAKFRSFLELRGIDIKDTRMFFHMIKTTTHCTEIELEDFVTTCLKVRGPATSVDLHAMMWESKINFAAQKRFQKYVDDRLERLEHLAAPPPPSGSAGTASGEQVPAEPNVTSVSQPCRIWPLSADGAHRC